MPKKITLWECDGCDRAFETEQEAIECNEEHAKIDSLEVVNAREFQGRFPKQILVRDRSYSGVLAQYVLVFANSVEEFTESESEWKW